MHFIINGINSYVDIMDGMTTFEKGLKEIRDGKDYISEGVLKRINIRREYPKPSNALTCKQTEVVRLACCGFQEEEIADTLQISRRTLGTHKTNIYTTLNVRNPAELMRTSLCLGIVSPKEIGFFPKKFTVNPKPDFKAAR